MAHDEQATQDNYGKRCEQAQATFIAEGTERAEREAFEHANVRLVFQPMTAERLRKLANDMRARQGLGPLPEPAA